MKLIINTVYENVDAEWLGWWLENTDFRNRLPNKAEDLLNGDYCEFTSKDKTSEVRAKTTYKLDRDPQA
jgi:hypothetical protein